MSRYLSRTKDWVVLARKARYRSPALARLQEISVRQLERYFVEAFGRRPQHWLDELRLIDAALLLINGRRVKEVAGELDYSNVSHFSHRFKAYFGCSPSDFIQLHQERLAERKEQFQRWCPGESIPDDWLLDPILANVQTILGHHVQPLPTFARSPEPWPSEAAA